MNDKFKLIRELPHWPISILLYCLVSSLMTSCENSSQILYESVERGGSATTDNGTYVRLDSILAKFTGDSVVLPKNYYTTMQVISDNRYGNIEEGSFVMRQQFTTANGAILKCTGLGNIAPGTILTVNLENVILSKKNGEFTFYNVPVRQITDISTEYYSEEPADIDAARLKTFATIFPTQYEGRLVRLPAGRFSGKTGNFSGWLQYTDSTGSIATRIYENAVFYGKNFPDSTVSLTGIARINDDGIHVDIRSLNDLTVALPHRVAEDFSSADISYYYSQSKKYTDVLETDLMYWEAPDGINKVKLVKSGDADASFLEQGKVYLTVMPVIQRNTAVSGLYNNLRPYYYNGLNHADSVRVTFAGSFMGAADYPPDNKVVFDAFDAAKHGYKLQAVVSKGYATKVSAESRVFNDRGVWHTVTLPVNGTFSKICVAQTATTGTNAMETSDGSYSSSKYYQHGLPVIVGKVELIWRAYY